MPASTVSSLRPSGNSTVAVVFGGTTRDASVLHLVVAHGAKPALEEGVAVVVEHRSRSECLRVTCPAEPLITLRTVGGNVDEVAALSPDDVALQLVQLRMGGLKGTDAREIRVDYG